MSCTRWGRQRSRPSCRRAVSHPKSDERPVLQSPYSAVTDDRRELREQMLAGVVLPADRHPVEVLQRGGFHHHLQVVLARGWVAEFLVLGDVSEAMYDRRLQGRILPIMA